MELILIASAEGGSSLCLHLLQAFLRMLGDVLGDELTCLEEVVEGHGAVLLNLRLTKGHTLLYKLIKHILWRSCALIFLLLLGRLLGLHNIAEALQLLILIEIIVFAGLGKVGQVKTELSEDSVGDLACLNGFNLSQRLRGRRVPQGLKFAEHVHVFLELELGGLDDVSLTLRDRFSIQSEADIIILLLDSISRLRVV